ncbi:MAG: DUF3604 domain-containing protein [bacterium]|nr:hypothetical protein [Deltaproteobacteria bacterium]MCP4907121.1 DUF3604 domain-containing protein [bacterium]
MRCHFFVVSFLLSLGLFSLSSGCEKSGNRGEEATSSAALPAVEEHVEAFAQPLKDAYFGDLHIHSSWSLDAFAFGVRVGPEEAYRYARGGAIDHVSGAKIQMKGPPLDFIALTEHANYLGIPSAAQDPESPIHDLPLIQGLLTLDPVIRGEALTALFENISSDTFIPELSNEAVVESAWREIIDLADRHDTPGEFTAFIAYEYTSMPEGQNLHRNVIFQDSNVPTRPFSTFDSRNPEDLWAWMEGIRATGSDVIAIPHNANGSNGLMYQQVDQSGRPMDAEYAELRVRNEPVGEVMQIKGQSETHPGLSPNDEWAGFSVLDTILGRPTDKSRLQGSYARRALMDGLEMEEQGGFNPYLFGMIGASDGHNASSPVEENNYTGKIGVVDGTPEVRIIPPASSSDLDIGDLSSGSPFGAAGLAGVWAEANTRAHLFAALRAREVFATSGPRIRVRFFAGWELEPADLETGMAEAGDARGVPMGGELGRADPGSRSPTFLMQALRDPLEAPLERMQIVKAWVEGGEARERVYDVACADGEAPEVASHRCALGVEAPDLSDCSYDASKGRSELSTAWSDPDFDADQRAFYYARVIQIPTCRWSTFDGLRLGVPPPPGASAWLQERAVTSPIWYRP